MKHLVAMLMLALVSACASGPTKTSRGSDERKLVHVTGAGSSLEEAKANGFNRAIEFVVGTVIVSEKESKSDKLASDDIINHSSGYVDSYNVLNTTKTSNKVVVDMEVYVKHSVIANRILNKDKESTVLDGDKLSWQYRSYLESRKTGMEVYRTVLNDYPVRAFSVKKTGSEFMLDRNNNAILVASYRMDWNYNYILSLNETLGLLADAKNRDLVQNKVIVSSKNPKNIVMGSMDTFYYNDDTLYSLIYEKLHTFTVVYAILIDTRGNTVKCKQAHHEMVSGGSYLSVQGATPVESQIHFSIEPSAVGKLNDVFHIELGISGDTDYCANINKR